MERRGNFDLVEYIYEDNHLLAANKPSGMPSQPDATGDPSLDAVAKEYLRKKYAKPGDAYLALLHRLDRPTSGVVLMAKTGKAATRMAELFRRREMEKRYLALVECHARPEKNASLIHFLVPGTAGGMKAMRTKRGAAREARLSYRVLSQSKDGKRALLDVDLETGVKHQIRCQLAFSGLPVVGDFRYGAFGEPARPEAAAGGRAVLLHARRASFTHPVRREKITVTAPMPAHWRRFLAAFPSETLSDDAGNLCS